MTPAVEAALRVLTDAQRAGLTVRVGPRTVGGQRPEVSGATAERLVREGLATKTYGGNCNRWWLSLATAPEAP